MKKFAAYWLPVYLYMGLIFYLSSRSVPPEPLYIFKFDKAVHFVEYAVLGLLLIRALNRQYSRQALAVLKCIAICIAILYGASDEFHQKFVPGRNASLFDLMADASGAAFGACVVFKRRKYIWQR